MVVSDVPWYWWEDDVDEREHMLGWSTDPRRRHPFTVLYMRLMWLRRDKQAFEGAQRTLRTARRRQQSGDAPPTRRARWVHRVGRAHRHGMTVWSVQPRRRRPVVRVVYLHGGGYVHPLTSDYWRLVSALARTPALVEVPAYPLAPDATVDDVLPALVALAADDVDRLPTVVMGDSAGGALALVVARRLCDGDGPEPRRVVCLSPWLDATLSEPEVRDLEASDPMLAESGLRAAGRWWAGRRDPADPEVSPQATRLDGLPPVDVLVGDRDILRPAVETLAERARDADVDLRVHEVTSMFHVWMTRAIPEGRRTRRALVALLRTTAASPPG